MTAKRKNVTKRQHYVPQFYLRYFSDDKSRIFVFDKTNRKTFAANIADIAHEKFFYEMPKIDDRADLEKNNLDEKTMIEDALQFYDGICAQEISGVIQNLRASKVVSRAGEYLFNLSDQQKMGLSYFAAIQDMRTREARESIAQMNQMMTEAVVEMIAGYKFPDIDMSKYKIQTNDIYNSLIQAQLLLNEDHLQGIARVNAYNRIWYLGVNRTANPLFISDHPIIKRSHDPHPFYRGTGWISPYLEVAIPLTPELILIQICPSVYKKQFKYGMEWSQNNLVLPLNDEHVSYYNSIQCMNSFRFIYSSVDEWSLVKSYLSDFPKYSNPYRQRATVSGGYDKRKLPADWGKNRLRTK